MTSPTTPEVPGGGRTDPDVAVPADVPQWPTEEHQPDARHGEEVTTAELQRRRQAWEDQVTVWLRSLQNEQFYLEDEQTVLKAKVEKVNIDFDTLEATLIDLSYRFSAIDTLLPDDDDDVDQPATDAADDTGDLAAAFAQATATATEQHAAAAAGGPEALAQATEGERDGAEGSPMPSLSELHAWVDEQIAPLVRKTTTTGEGGGIRWCRRWWLHRDAVDRFSALFLAHAELARTGEASWLSVYLRDHLDPHLSTLTSPYGPFHLCRPDRHAPTVIALGQSDHVDQMSGGT